MGSTILILITLILISGSPVPIEKHLTLVGAYISETD